MQEAPNSDATLPETIPPEPSLLRRYLPWPQSTAILSLMCYPVAWLCTQSTAGNDDLMAYAFTLVFLLGLDPFFMRRNRQFSLLGLLAVFGAGLGLAGFGWLISFNFIVVAWIGMTWTLQVAAQPTKYGNMIDYQIGLEKQSPADRSRWLNTLTEQNERMLAVGDFVLVLIVGFLLLWAFNAIAAESFDSINVSRAFR